MNQLLVIIFSLVLNNDSSFFNNSNKDVAQLEHFLHWDILHTGTAPHWGSLSHWDAVTQVLTIFMESLSDKKQSLGKVMGKYPSQCCPGSGYSIQKLT